MRRPVLTLSTKQPEGDQASEGELTAEALRDLSKAFQGLGGQSAFGIGSMSEMFRSPGLSKAIKAIEVLSSSFEPLGSIARFTEALSGPLPGFSLEFKKIAADCIGPDGELDLKKFKIKARVRLGLSPNEPLALSEREFVAYFQEHDRRDRARDREQAQLTAELIAGCIMARACAESKSEPEPIPAEDGSQPAQPEPDEPVVSASSTVNESDDTARPTAASLSPKDRMLHDFIVDRCANAFQTLSNPEIQTRYRNLAEGNLGIKFRRGTQAFRGRLARIRKGKGYPTSEGIEGINKTVQ